MVFYHNILRERSTAIWRRNPRAKNTNVTSGTVPVYLSDVSQIERRVSPHDFREPEWIPRAKRRALPSCRGRKRGVNSYFFPSNLFGLLSPASLVCSIIMVPVGPAANRPGRPIGRPVEIVNGSSYGDARQISFLPSRIRSVKFIYLVNRPARRYALNSISFHEEKSNERQKEIRQGGKGSNSDRDAPLFRFAVRPYSLFRLREVLSASPVALCLVALVCYLLGTSRHEFQGFSWHFNYDRVYIGSLNHWKISTGLIMGSITSSMKINKS